MSRVMKITQRIVFVIAICICLSYVMISADQRRGILTPSDSANLSSYSAQSVSVAESLAESRRAFSPFYAKSEPLLLLLSGIAMFVGATAVKKAFSRGYRAGGGQAYVNSPGQKNAIRWR